MPAYVNVTKDGSDIGVVAFAGGNFWYETADVARMPATAFAAQIYNDTGMRHHKAGDHARAAKLFARAESVRPKGDVYTYNLACARVRLSDMAGAEEAFARASRAAVPASPCARGRMTISRRFGRRPGS